MHNRFTFFKSQLTSSTAHKTLVKIFTVGGKTKRKENYLWEKPTKSGKEKEIFTFFRDLLSCNRRVPQWSKNWMKLNSGFLFLHLFHVFLWLSDGWAWMRANKPFFWMLRNIWFSGNIFGFRLPSRRSLVFFCLGLACRGGLFRKSRFKTIVCLISWGC